MKKLKKIMSLLCVLCMLVNALVAGASNEQNSEADLVIVDGKLSNEAMMETIEEYLNSKKMGAEEFASVLEKHVSRSTLYTNRTEINEFEVDAANRYEGFHDFELRLGVDFNSVTVDSRIDRIVSENGNMVVLDVYETTVIEYFAIEGQSEPDIMAYGTEHVMTLELIGGEYQIISDQFDERIITGVCSQEVLNMENNVDILMQDETDITYATVGSRSITSSTYNVTNAIAYANQWCGISGSYTDFDGAIGGSDTGGYNSAYTPFPGVDCANFVSQCLVAGGLGTDNTWQPYTTAWVNAKALHWYLNEHYETVRANNVNVFPGNPVYWWNGTEFADDASPSGHQMICTGYNSAGTPVVNGHTPNAFRVPITGYLNNGSGLYTAQIVDENLHEHIWQGYYTDAHNHYRYCKMCRIGLVTGAHQVVSGTCTICGYTGPFAADLK